MYCNDQLCTNTFELSYDSSDELQENFNPFEMIKYPFILALGKRQSGKSFLVNDLVIKLNPSEKVIKNSLMICHSMHEEQILNIKMTNHLDDINEFWNDIQNNDTDAILILDNVLYGTKWTSNPVLMNILMNGKDYRITIIIQLQCQMNITSEFRKKFNYVCMIGEDDDTRIKKYWENYGEFISTLSDFKKIINDNTKKYGVCVIDQQQNKIFRYKADLSSIWY
jgi:hypothetical protein